MPWKRDENDLLIVNENGDPIWLDEEGNERSVDYQAMSAALSRANRESSDRKTRLRELESRYGALDEIEDFESWYARATEALTLLQSLTDNGQSLDDHVAARIGEATAALREQLAAAEEGRLQTALALERRTIEAAFAGSQFVRDHLVSPTLAADLFARHFILDEQGRLICQGLEDEVPPDGDPLDFDEALARLVDRYPGRDFILKGGSGSGSGAQPWSTRGGGRGNSRRLADCRTENDKLDYLNRVGA